MNTNLIKSRGPWFPIGIAQRHHLLPIVALAVLALLCIQGRSLAQENLRWTAADSTDWNTSAANWSGDSTIYADGDFVDFRDPIPAGGTVIVQPGGVNPGGVDVTNDTGTYTISGGPIGGSGGLLKSGSGALILDSSIIYSGSTTVSGGTLTINGALGSTSQSISISVLTGASLAITEPGDEYVTTSTAPGDFTGDLNIGAGVALEVAGGASVSTPVLINGGGTVNIQGSNSSIAANGALEIDNNIVLNSRGLPQPFSTSFTASLSSLLAIGGIVSGNSDVSFVSAGNNTSPLFLLNTAATYTGNTDLDYAFGGVLRLGAENALPITTQLAFADHAGALDLNGFDQTISALSDQGYDNGITNTGLSTSTLTVGQDIDTTFAGTIGDPTVTGSNLIPQGGVFTNINFVKKGTGSLRLTGNETYTGYTTVSAGTLVVNGGINGSFGGVTNTSGVSVTTGATLAGQGLISVAQGGQVVIGNGAAISPGDTFSGDSPTGVLTVTDPSGSPSANGTFDLESGGTLFISLQAFEPGGSQDPGNNAASADSQLVVARQYLAFWKLVRHFVEWFHHGSGRSLLHHPEPGDEPH